MHLNNRSTNNVLKITATNSTLQNPHSISTCFFTKINLQINHSLLLTNTYKGKNLITDKVEVTS